MSFDTNERVAEALDEYAELYGLDGATSRKCAAYRNAAEIVRECGSDISTIAPTSLTGIGPSTGGAIREILRTGTFSKLRVLQSQYPVDTLRELARVRGIGFKRAYALINDYNIRTVKALSEALDSGRVSDPSGALRNAVAELVAMPENPSSRGSRLASRAGALD